MSHELDVDALAQEIRRVDGKHDLGAGQLAEALMPFLVARAHPPTDAGVSEAHYYSKAESAYDEADERRAALSQNEGDRK